MYGVEMSGILKWLRIRGTSLEFIVVIDFLNEIPTEIKKIILFSLKYLLQLSYQLQFPEKRFSRNE